MTYTITADNVSTVTRAEAQRWLQAYDGQVLNTVQYAGEGTTGRVTWVPGPRTLTVVGNGKRGRLDGSEVRFTPQHRNLRIVGDALQVTWYDEDGAAIHTTVYSVYPATVVTSGPTVKTTGTDALLALYNDEATTEPVLTLARDELASRGYVGRAR